MAPGGRDVPQPGRGVGPTAGDEVAAVRAEIDAIDITVVSDHRMSDLEGVVVPHEDVGHCATARHSTVRGHLDVGHGIRVTPERPCALPALGIPDLDEGPPSLRSPTGCRPH